MIKNKKQFIERFFEHILIYGWVYIILIFAFAGLIIVDDRIGITQGGINIYCENNPDKCVCEEWECNYYSDECDNLNEVINR